MEVDCSAMIELQLLHGRRVIFRWSGGDSGIEGSCNWSRRWRILAF